MVPEPSHIPSDSPAAKTVHVRQVPVPVFPFASKLAQCFINQRARILNINTSFTLVLVYTLLTAGGSKLDPLCETVTLRRE